MGIIINKFLLKLMGEREWYKEAEKEGKLIEEKIKIIVLFFSLLFTYNL